MDQDDTCLNKPNSIKSIEEYLNCAKKVFERRLENEKMIRTKADEFILHKTIGLGAFGRVLLVNHNSDPNTFLAMKVMKKEQVLRKNNVQHVLNEKRFLAAIRHPFIMHMLYFAKDHCNLYFIMPFAIGGDLFSLLREKGSLGEFNAKFYSGQMVLALEYLHTLDIIYRDLKPENILIDGNGYIKLTDLGFCKRVVKRTYTMCGTPQYLAPEVILLKGYGKAVDWWSFGVITYEMVTGSLPFDADSDRRMYKKIIAGFYKIPNNISPDLTDLIQNLLQTDLTKRYGSLKNGTDDIKQHRWFRTIDWLMLLNRSIRAPCVPNYSGPSDTSNFEKFSEEKIFGTVCNNKDHGEFSDF
ncbi:cAMP-dependent protein kinase catalytic subunit alpha-like [Daktulosphaira vitifoliae]|uniref:cAMP-dependent protein kinase catalytic subunit alpha-like n=1 Tax=Daktulosphaira vitifoliae TaxID=58002 RepID=UPI0021AA734E|nr:cAMP-dependent protein kinase catalytic subunit alpha-like [Daktulosphaira vitifoliae]